MVYIKKWMETNILKTVGDVVRNMSNILFNLFFIDLISDLVSCQLLLETIGSDYLLFTMLVTEI